MHSGGAFQPMGRTWQCPEVLGLPQYRSVGFACILGTTSHGDRHRMVAIPSSGNWVVVDKAGEGTGIGKASSGLSLLQKWVCSSLPESDIESGGLTARNLPFQLL